ncbi:MAG: hypothetical protein JNK46_08925 [Methylobacteriaceae bacterium]|nr:hypothetical protein [Methylobacteriaceae bacterium]
MPLQNRVDPFGRLVATPARGTMMGNRGGRFHTDDRTLGARRAAGRAWICCELEFKGRRRDVWTRGYTELFYLDEATALAAGARPCFECRRAQAHAFRDAAFGRALRAPEMDRILAAERAAPPRRIAARDVGALPDGAMVAIGAQAYLVLDGALRPWSFAGYGPAVAPLSGDVALLTPPSGVTALRRGYAARLHPTASSPASPDRGAPA